jgi:hypothetical protein
VLDTLDQKQDAAEYGRLVDKTLTLWLGSANARKLGPQAEATFMRAIEWVSSRLGKNSRRRLGQPCFD